MKPPAPIAFIDLKAQQDLIKPKIDAAIARVLAHGNYIMGAEVAEFEKQLSAFCGAKHSISCSNGTDAIALILMAKDVKAGDAIFVPSFTFAATAEVIAWMGASAVFVDCDPRTYNICPADLEKAIAHATKQNLKPTGIITVDLFGLPADYTAIENIANTHDLWILDDAAQGFGASHRGRKLGTIGMATATSFFPAKPLGCYGDGGAIFTDDDELADIIKSLRIHGKGTDKYDNTRVGMNGRLDTLQAAILIEKLAIFPEEIAARQKIAQAYNDGFSDVIQTPVIGNDNTCVWAQYTLALKEGQNRDAVLEALKDAGVPTAVYYPKPLHLQTAYLPQERTGNGILPVCESLAGRVFSLPMHPYLDKGTQDYIINSVRSALKP